jgi:hypothetical protein
MFPLLMMLFQQPQLRATQPNFFFPVVVLLLIAGGVAWLIAAVLGFARSPAFGPSARWFSYAAVCLLSITSTFCCSASLFARHLAKFG